MEETKDEVLNLVPLSMHDWKTYPLPPIDEPVVYLLRSRTGRATYVGSTMNLYRRLRQHCGIIKGGAKRTRGRGWSLVCIIRGFASWNECLSVEKRIQIHLRRIVPKAERAILAAKQSGGKRVRRYKYIGRGGVKERLRSMANVMEQGGRAHLRREWLCDPDTITT